MNKVAIAMLASIQKNNLLGTGKRPSEDRWFMCPGDFGQPRNPPGYTSAFRKAQEKTEKEHRQT